MIWLKVGADKRRVNSKEELRRLFQVSGQFHADELPTKAGVEALDKLRFRDFLRDVYKRKFPEEPSELLRLLQNMNLATDEGILNLAEIRTSASRISRIFRVIFPKPGRGFEDSSSGERGRGMTKPAA